jgi:hypothetical protein
MTEETITTEDVAAAADVLGTADTVDLDACGLAFRVLPPNGEWFAEGERYAADADGAPGEIHCIVKPAKELVRLAGSGHAAGVIEVLKGLDVSHVESQEDSEAAQAAAQEAGTWHVGNDLQYDLSLAHADLARAQAAEDEEQIAAANERLERVEQRIADHMKGDE